MDRRRPNLFSDDPEELLALAELGARVKALDKRRAAQRRSGC